MQASAAFFFWATLGFGSVAVLLTLLQRQKGREFCFGLTLLCGGGWLITHACALRAQGLMQTMGRTAHIVRAAAHPTEAWISFGFFCFMGVLLSVGGLLYTVASGAVMLDKSEKEA